MSRIALFSHAPSDTVNALKAFLEEQGQSVIKIKRTGSRFQGRQGDILVNYGSSSMPSNLVGRATLLNNPEAISSASNKLNAFRQLAAAEVKTVEWTDSRDTAQSWLTGGALVYARTTLQGHSGEGIELSFSNPAGVGDAGNVPVSATLPNARLYTKAIMSERREFRIHVMNGRITYVQQKKRRDGYREIEGFSNLVRNYHTGWIYATQMSRVNDQAISESLKAIEALGLDYGAVDVITRREEAWVLEVNTAPGMTGTNLETFANNLIRLSNGEEVEQFTNETSANLETLQNEIRNETRASREQPEPTPAAVPEPVPVPEQAPAPAPTARRSSRSQSPQQAAPTQQPSSSTALVNNGVYLITVAGESTVGKYNTDMGHFEILGWDIPVEASEATVVRSLCVL